MGGVRFNLLLLFLWLFVRLSIIIIVIILVFVGECAAAVGSRGDGGMDWLCDVDVGGYGVYLYWDSEDAVVVVVVVAIV